MIKAKIAEICKDETGYSVDLSAGDAHGQWHTHNFETFPRVIDFIANAMGISDEERRPMVVVHEGRQWGKTEAMERLYPGNFKFEKAEPTYEELRDELGESRRAEKRQVQQILELTQVNARLVKAEKAADENVNKVEADNAGLRKSLDQVLDTVKKRTAYLIAHNINVNTGKKSAPRKR